MGLAYLSAERKKYIDGLVERLTKIYSVGLHIDFESMARDFEVIFPDVDYMVYFSRQKGKKFYLCGPKKSIPAVRRYGQAHELGHILLNLGDNARSKAEKEEEADYFAIKLGARPPHGFLLYLEAAWALWRNRHQILNYAKSVDKKTLEEVVRDRKALEELLKNDDFYRT